MRLAVLADIHGNLPALEAVLADMAGLGVDAAVDLGDRVSGPLWPAETLALLTRSAIPAVRGNHDRLVGSGDPGMLGRSDRYAHGVLDAAAHAALAALPMRLDIGPGIVCFHAQPDVDEAYLIEDIEQGRLVRAPVARIARRLGDVAARLVLCGHSHRPDLIGLRDGRLVLNPGSIGYPAYDDEEGAPHVSEQGTPHARYAVVDDDGSAWPSVTFRAVAYDHERAARQAEANGRADWAFGLRTGRMPDAVAAARRGTWREPAIV
jgi:predicted phosphodiesterase